MLTGYKALDHNIPSAVIRSEKEFIKQHERSESILNQLKAAENILNILRPIAPVQRKLDQAAIEKWMAVMAHQEKEGAMVQEAEESALVVQPNTYFAERFPTQSKSWGPSFFGSQEFMNGRTTFVAQSINDLAFAAILGGDSRLGQQVVYYPSEAQWYFFDYRVDAFCPTTDEKMALLASNWLVRCSQACHPISGRSVLKLRTPGTFKSIITTAKSLLEADVQFFHGSNGHRRFIDGAYLEPDSAPAHRLFVKRGMVRQKDASLTVGAAYTRYRGLCDDLHERPLTRAEFKDIVKEAISEEYQVRLRHDVIDGATNRMTHGWRGVALASGNEAFQLN